MLNKLTIRVYGNRASGKSAVLKAIKRGLQDQVNIFISGNKEVVSTECGYEEFEVVYDNAIKDKQ